MIERRKRAEIQKEMEEYLLQRQMQYEHQIQVLTRNLQESKHTNRDKTSTNSEVENLTQTLFEFQSRSEATSNGMRSNKTKCIIYIETNEQSITYSYIFGLSQ